MFLIVLHSPLIIPTLIRLCVYSSSLHSGALYLIKPLSLCHVSSPTVLGCWAPFQKLNTSTNSQHPGLETHYVNCQLCPVQRMGVVAEANQAKFKR